MGFVAWHYLGRGVALPLFALAAVLMLVGRGPDLDRVRTAALGLFAVLGVVGALLALLLLFTPFRWACPRCRSRRTEFGVSEAKAMWLRCETCGVLREAGFLKLRLRWDGPTSPDA